MTRFRCAIVDEAGVAGTRLVDARSRDQAMLLLLAEGLTPSSIMRDAPSLAERMGPAAADGVADILLQDLARLAASGFSIAEAAAAIDGEAARRIAAGTPVGKVMTGTQGISGWIGTALTLSADHENEPGALIEIAEDAATIALRRGAIRGAWMEAGLMSAAIAALIIAMILIDVVAGLALCLAIYLALRNPFHAFRQSIRSNRQADFLLIVGRLLIAGAALRDSARIAADDVLADHEKTPVDAALAAQSNDSGLLADIGRRLGLSAPDRAIMARDDIARGARAVSAHLVRSSRPALDGMLTILRMIFIATIAIVVIVLAME
jgi:hypothetical protein